MVVFLRTQGRISDGAMIQATSVDNSISINHLQLMMANSPLMCSTRKDSLYGPSSSDGVECTRGLTELVNLRHSQNLQKDLP